MRLADYIKVYPFEFCAARFLAQWEKHEEGLYTGLSTTPTDQIVVKALRYFQVARNFVKLSDDPLVSGRIVEALLSIRSNGTLVTPVDKVNALAAIFQRDFNQFNLSAATKLLWLSFRSPFVVYDKRAVKSLSKHAKHKRITKNYVNFSNAWRTEFQNCERAIETAILNLPNGRAFMPQTHLTDAELKSLATKPWFKERVFDIFLWETGGEM